MKSVPYHELLGISVEIVEPGSSRARLALDCEAQVSVGERLVYPARLLDIGLGGARLLLEGSVPLGDEVLLTLHLPDEGPPALLSALAVRGRSSEGSKRELGVAFMGLEPEDSERILALVYAAAEIG